MYLSRMRRTQSNSGGWRKLAISMTKAYLGRLINYLARDKLKYY